MNKATHWLFHGIRARLSDSSLGVAHITPLVPIAQLDAKKIQSLLERLALMGTTNVFTSAISRSQQSFFETLGFEPYDDLNCYLMIFQVRYSNLRNDLTADAVPIGNAFWTQTMLLFPDFGNLIKVDYLRH